MACNNIRILNNNLIEGGDLVSSITAGSTAAGFPVANLQNSIKALSWRSTSTATPQAVRINFTTPQTLSMISVLFTNLSHSATIVVRLYTLPDDDSPVYTSSLTPVFNKNVSVSGLSGSKNTFSYGRGCSGVIYFPETTVQKIIINFEDTSNADGFLEVGNLVVGKYWEPVKNFAKGETFQIVDTSTHFRSDSGDLWTESSSRFRKIGLRLDTMLKEDRDVLVNLFRTNGKSLPLFISLYPENPDSNKENMYMMQGKLEDLAQIDHPLTLYYGAPLTFIEI